MSGIVTVVDLAAWLVDSALPTWATRGFDAGRGRFHERLDEAGAPLDVPYRSMVQARQIFVYAEACRAGWFADGGELAERALDSLERDFAVIDGERLGFRFASHGPGAANFDSYGHAFVLLALAALHKLAPSRRLLAMVERTTRFVEEMLVDPSYGGLFDAAPCSSTDKRQNPVMHLLEAQLALEEAMPGRGHLERAARLFRLFEQRLFDSSSGALREYFARDWSRCGDEALADLVEPGHLFEWTWLIDRFGALSGKDVRGLTETLARAAACGVTTEHLIVDALAAPDLRVTADSHRLWPHSEALKAAVVAHRAGDAQAHRAADGFACALGRHFLDRPFAGGWVDRVDRAGVPLVSEVPASSLYHLLLAGLEAANAFAVPTMAFGVDPR